MFNVTAYYWLKYYANKKFCWEVAKECYLTSKQKQLSQTISIKIQLPLFWGQHYAVPLPVKVAGLVLISELFSESSITLASKITTQ